MHIEYLISRLLQLYQNVVQYHNALSKPNLIDTFTYIYIYIYIDGVLF